MCYVQNNCKWSSPYWNHDKIELIWLLKVLLHRRYTKRVTVVLFYFIIFYFLFFINLFIYLFLAVLGLRFCARAFSSCGERGPLLIAVHGPLTVEASLIAERRLQTRRLSSCGSRAQPLRGMWDLPRPGHEPVSPASAGRLSTTAPPGKPTVVLLKGKWEISTEGIMISPGVGEEIAESEFKYGTCVSCIEFQKQKKTFTTSF